MFYKSDIQNRFAVTFGSAFNTRTEYGHIALHCKRKGEDIAVVYYKVRAGLAAPIDLLRELTGIVYMDTGTEPCLASLGKDLAHRSVIFRMGVLFRDTETGRKIVRSDQDTVETVYFDDSIFDDDEDFELECPACHAKLDKDFLFESEDGDDEGDDDDGELKF